MKEYLPYIVSVICSLISGITSIVVCIVQINRNQKETEQKLVTEKEKIQLDFEKKSNFLEKNML